MLFDEGQRMDDTDVPKRRWFRFRLRTVFIILTFVCLYFACWFPTKTRGVADVKKYLDGSGAPAAQMPLVVTTQRLHVDIGLQRTTSTKESEYYFWFFGVVMKLPIATQQTKPLPNVQQLNAFIRNADVGPPVNLGTSVQPNNPVQ